MRGGEKGKDGRKEERRDSMTLRTIVDQEGTLSLSEGTDSKSKTLRSPSCEGKRSENKRVNVSCSQRKTVETKESQY